MPRFGLIKRGELVTCLCQLGFSGPYSGGKHEFMQKGGLSLTLPNLHEGDIRPRLLAKVLRQAGVERSEWERL